MTQFCIEEAVGIVYDAAVNRELEQEQAPAAAGPRPGEITDPELQQAMAQARRLHEQTHGPLPQGMGRG